MSADEVQRKINRTSCILTHDYSGKITKLKRDNVALRVELRHLADNITQLNARSMEGMSTLVVTGGSELESYKAAVLHLTDCVNVLSNLVKGKGKTSDNERTKTGIMVPPQPAKASRGSAKRNSSNNEPIHNTLK